MVKAIWAEELRDIVAAAMTRAGLVLSAEHAYPVDAQ